MASGRLPGDFWPRHPGFRPPGAESSGEDDNDQDGVTMDEEEAEGLMDDMMDYVMNHPSSDDEMAMKRPSAKAMKRPAAKAGLPAGASTVPKAKAKAKGKAKADKTTKPKAKAKPKATASAKGKGKSKSNGNTKGKGKSKGKRSGKDNSKGKGKNKSDDDETAEVETTKDEEPVTVRSLGSDGLPVDETVGGSQSRPADQQPQKFGCSKCRYKGCSKCRQ